MSNLPFVSIVIPALNSEATMGKCLQSIKSLNYPEKKYEIVVVDNGSADMTAEIAKKYGARVLYKPDKKIGALRNCGAKVSLGEIIACTDSDLPYFLYNCSSFSLSRYVTTKSYLSFKTS